MEVLKIIVTIVVVVILIFVGILCLAMCAVSKVADEEFLEMEGYRKEREGPDDKMSV